MPRAFLLLLLLGACRLVDQTTFDPALRARLLARKPPAAPPAAGTAPALVTIRFDRPVDYAPALRRAVIEARRRKPDVFFDVVTVVPRQGTEDEQIAAVARDGGDARRVASELEADGVEPGQIGLGARVEPGLAGHEVRVYVR